MKKFNLSDFKVEQIGRRHTYLYVAALFPKTFFMLPKRFGSKGIGECILFDNGINRFFWMYKKGAFEECFNKYEDDLSEIRKLTDELFVKFQDALKEATIVDIETFFKFHCEMNSIPMILRCLERVLMSKLKKFLSEDMLSAATSPNKESISLKEELELLRLAKQKIKPEEIELKLKLIFEKYKYSLCGYDGEKPKIFSEYIIKFNDITNPEIRETKIINRINKSYSEKKEIINRLNKTQKKLVLFAQELTYLKDYTKFVFSNLFGLIHPAFQKFKKKYDISEEELKFLLPKNILDLIHGKSIDIKLAIKQNKKMFFIGYSEQYKQYTGKKVTYFESQILKNIKISELKGRVASKGCVKGYVKIVLSHEDFKKVKKGDILVVTNTTPDFVPTIKKSAGIISEEGGITAHVSVISREFGIPSIVGVKNVTELLKDGDLVEVDANKGVVRKIK